MLGIKGLRGVGKTILLLQFLKYKFPEKEKGLYVTADHPHFYQNSLFDLAAEWYQNGGKLLLIDEVHKYPNWSRELKLMYDGHPDLQIIFTSSSALDLYRGESDLSRRLAVRHLKGLSFREFLSFQKNIDFDVFSLEEILKNHSEITQNLNYRFQPLPLFKEYLKIGYFPFTKKLKENAIFPRFSQMLNTVLESDLAIVQDYSAANIAKIKKLLGVIASSAPFEPNISKIAQKLNIGRNTATQYLHHLRDAQILNFLNKSRKGISRLQKPNKIYFENTNLAFALQNPPEVGTVRETFVANQLKNAEHAVHLAEKGDFLVDKKYAFEIGGKGKGNSQIKDVENSYLILDEVEQGFGRKIPIWLLGFLY